MNRFFYGKNEFFKIDIVFNVLFCSLVGDILEIFLLCRFFYIDFIYVFLILGDIRIKYLLLNGIFKI